MTEIKNIKIIHSKDEAIKRIQAAYGGVVKNLIKEILNDERLVEECMSEVWYRLSVHLSKFEDLGSHKTRAYICKTAIVRVITKHMSMMQENARLP